MNSRDMLYRTVLRPGSTPIASDSPSLSQRDMSPMSSLAFNFHTASLNVNTPRRKLSLSSDSSFSSHDLSSQSPSFLQESLNSEHDSYQMSPSRKSFVHEKSGISSPCNNDETTLMSPPASTILSPTRKMMARNKENFPSPYFSPSHSSSQFSHRPRQSPLKELQNTVNRNLTFSPMKKKLQMISPTKRVLSSPHKPSPPEDFDTNSQDSGYSESGKKFEDTCFSVPISCAPRRLNLDTPPKVSTTICTARSITSTTTSALTVPCSTPTGVPADERKSLKRFTSLNKDDEEDAMMMDLLNEMPNQEDLPPTGLSNLLSAPIQKLETPPSFQLSSRPSFKRCLSMVDITPASSRIGSFVSSPLDQLGARYGRFKRPEAPADLSSFIECKKRREDISILSPLNANSLPPKATSSPFTQRQVSSPEPIPVPKRMIVRSHSESHVSIMKALNKCSNHEGELTGDFSKPFALPIIEGGKHPDLKAISVDTMAELLKGDYSKQIASFKIVDCRYPYEYEGGHIIGAEMFHHPKMIEDHLMDQKGPPVIEKESTPRHVLIFHCEFSAERGPKAQRLLRQKDRDLNKEHYPALQFPETYLLEGGYKAFFEKYPDLCTPKCYVRMLDSNHSDDLKLFRGRSKSWQAENKQSKGRNTVPRTGLKRLGL